MIHALAEQAGSSSKKKMKAHFVPYRDSVLTWILKENLGKDHLTHYITHTNIPLVDQYPTMYMYYSPVCLSVAYHTCTMGYINLTFEVGL